MNEEDVEHCLELSERIAEAYHSYHSLPKARYADEQRESARIYLFLQRALLRNFLAYKAGIKPLDKV